MILIKSLLVMMTKNVFFHNDDHSNDDEYDENDADDNDDDNKSRVAISWNMSKTRPRIPWHVGPLAVDL